MTNQIVITGNVGRDGAQLKYTTQGTAVLTFSVADDERKLNRDTNEWENTNTTWWNCQVWEGKAEAAAEVLVKGTRVIVTGRAKLREYENRDGGKGTSLDVQVQDVAVIPKVDRNSAPAPQRQAETPNTFEQEPPF